MLGVHPGYTYGSREAPVCGAGWAGGLGSKSTGMCSRESKEKVLFYANNQHSYSGKRGLYSRERSYSFRSREELSPQTHEIRTGAVYAHFTVCFSKM